MRRRWSRMAVVACLVLLTSITKGESLRFLRFLARFFRSLSRFRRLIARFGETHGGERLGPSHDNDMSNVTDLPRPRFRFRELVLSKSLFRKNPPLPADSIDPANAAGGGYHGISRRKLNALCSATGPCHQIHVITC
jgi:hypothetical protein